MSPRGWAKLLAFSLPALRCAACQTQSGDPFDPRGVGTLGASTAAGVTSAHMLGHGTLAYVTVPCGESRFIGYRGPSGLGGASGTSRILHRINAAARAEPAAGTLRARVSAPDGVLVHDQPVAIAATEGAGQAFDLRVDAGRPAPEGTWIVELRAEGACRVIRLTLSMHQSPLSGP